MAIELWTSADLLRTLTDDRLNGVPSYFLDTYFGQEHYSADREILLKDLPTAYRTLAPFVLPTEQGKPIYKEKPQAVRSFTPAYIKLKDTVSPVDAAVTAATIDQVLGGMPLTLQQRFDKALNARIDEHVRAIRTTWAWMAARAFIDGSVTIKYIREQGNPFPEATIAFGRDGGHTVVKNANYWDNTGTLILDDVEGYANTMHNAVRGGYPTRMYVGSSAAGVFRRNTQIKAELDTQRRGTEVNFKTGIQRVDRGLTYLGYLSAGIEVYAYKDEVEAPNGTLTPILGPKDILLVAPGAEGIKAFGAIYDTEAMSGGNISANIFPKMFKQDDPSAIFVMHQSAPLMIPLYPNRTFKATVLA